MKYTGRHISSIEPNLTINFRTSENNEDILDILKDFQQTKKLTNMKNSITTNIFTEKGAAYILLKSDFTERPYLKLLIDTGASITLIAQDVIKKDTKIKDYIIKLFGVVKNVSIKTQGLIEGKIIINNQELDSTVHLIEREHSGPADGYIGFDILSSYKTIIDMNLMQITFNTSNEFIGLSPDEDDFMKILAELYDFEENEITNTNEHSTLNTEKSNEQSTQFIKKTSEQSSRNITNGQQSHELEENLNNKTPKNAKNKEEKLWHKAISEKTSLLSSYSNDFEDYYEAANFYRNEIEKLNEIKVRSNENKYHSMSHFNLSEMNRSDIIYEKLNLSNCSEDEKEYIKQICEEFPYQFYIEGDKLGSNQCTQTPHKKTF